MLKISKDNDVKQITEFYNRYVLHVAGKIQNKNASELIGAIEKNFSVDSIQLSDGTHIWNLLRIFIYLNLEKQNASSKKTSFKSPFFILKEGFLPLKIPIKKNNICGFSSTESRKEYKGQFYDIYLDPLYEILGDELTVFEWPDVSGYRRKYACKVYSKNYVPMHIPIYTKTFWNIAFYKFLKLREAPINSNETLIEIIDFISKTYSIDKNNLKKKMYEFITIFYHIKNFLKKIIKNIHPKAVLIRCGYGRFPMALSQACRELKIPSIEIQHGLITASHPAYTKSLKSENKDCIPEYLLTHGDVFTEMIKKGNLFDKNKIFTVGHFYLDKIKKDIQESDIEKKTPISSFKYNLLFTSQWILAEEIKEFIIRVSEQLKKSKIDIGIIFKPHPYDKTDYSDMNTHENIILANKYEDTFKLFKIVDAHSTIYSISGLEAMAFGKPNIFVDICNLMEKIDTRFIADTPRKFIDTIQDVISDSKSSRQALELADMFYKSEPDKNFKNFFTKLGII